MDALSNLGKALQAVVAAIARAPRENGIAGLHRFPFGGFPRSAQWLSAVREGPFAVTPGESFRLEG